MTAADNVPAGTTFVAGSVTGASGIPPALTLAAPIAAGGAATVTFQVMVGNAVPAVNPIPNIATAAFTYTIDPAKPDGGSGSAISSVASTLVSSANVTATKTVDKAFANAGDLLTYTILLTNSGNAAANNVVLTDAVPAGTTFVAGSVVGATGAPPTLTLLAPIPAGGSATVSYQVKVGAAIPTPNPVPNTVTGAYSYTVDPAKPNAASGAVPASTATTQVNFAKLVLEKTTDKTISYLGDPITYQISIKNTGNVDATNVVLTDLIPLGAQVVAGSVNVSAPYTGAPDTGLSLVGPIAAGQTVVVRFQIEVLQMPLPNPIENTAKVTYAYVVDPSHPDSVTAAGSSNTVLTVIFRNHYAQQVSDLVHSVALEEAALANIANAEGAKIQKIVAMGNVSAHELLCLNKSVTDMLDSIAMLEAVLRQKLNAVGCQIDGSGTGC